MIAKDGEVVSHLSSRVVASNSAFANTWSHGALGSWKLFSRLRFSVFWVGSPLTGKLGPERVAWHPAASRFCGAGITDRGALFSYLADWETRKMGC